ncbi:MAG TPA: hypothetical protein VG734_15135 [Lacunisphaera sp.]|nr:hypothetical protein [Lacunisphaera sp.]
MATKRGVYFLANDKTYELAVTFLNSLRKYEKEVSLCLIPFDENWTRIASLADTYNFDVYNDYVALKKCDHWSERFHAQTKGQYRKLAAWNGDFDEFIYIDIDTVIMQSINPVFDLIKDFSVVTGHSHIEGSRKFVWKDSIRSTELRPDEINYAANTGFMLSRRGVLNFARIEELLPEAIAFSPHMELSCAEQPFLNFLIIRSGEPYTSLYKIASDSANPEMLIECWAGDLAWHLVVDGVCKYNTEPKNVLFVHWAGEWAPTEKHPVIANSCIRQRMKNAHIWNHYRALVPARQIAKDPLQ